MQLIKKFILFFRPLHAASLSLSCLEPWFLVRNFHRLKVIFEIAGAFLVFLKSA